MGGVISGTTTLVAVQPNVFKLGDGTVAAVTVVLEGDGSRVDSSTGADPTPAISAGDRLVLSSFVTGTAAGQNFSATCGGLNAPVLGAAVSPQFLAVEQVNIEPDVAALAVAGVQQFACGLTVDGAASNSSNVGWDYVP